MSESALFQRLKERKIVQWAIAYLAGAWVLVEATGHVVGLFQWPVVVTEVVTILAFFGFFVVLVVAWYHGEKGRQWVSGPELLIIALLLLISGGVLSMLGGPEDSQEPPIAPPSTSVEDDRPSIAVLPFQNRSGLEDDVYFTDGLHDQIITQLTKIGGLSVRGLTSVLVYRDSPKNLKDIGEELNARYIMEGGVQRAGETVRINVQLIEAATDEHLWASVYDRTMSVENLFSIQTEIVEAVTDSLRAVVTPEEMARIEAVPTENLDAYEAYMLGRYHLNRRDDPREAFSEAVRYFEIAIQEDPDLAVAHGALAEAYMLIATWGFRDPREVWPEVERWARSALALDNTVASAHLVLAPAQWVRDWNWEEAERKHQRALSLSPSNPHGHRSYMELLLGQGRIEEARQQVRIASALDPLSSPTLQSQARLAFFSRRHEEADELVEVLLSRDPENSSAAWPLALSSLFGGRPEQVERLYPRVTADSANLGPRQRATRAVFLSLLGESELARTEIGEALSGWGDQYFEPRSTWRTYAALGEKDEAFFWMGRSIDVQSIHAAFLAVDPFADGLRDDPRYRAILDRIGLGHLKARFDSLAAADPRGGT